MGEYRDIFAFVGVLFVCCGSLYLFYRAWRFCVWVNKTLVAVERRIDFVDGMFRSTERRLSNLESL